MKNGAEYENTDENLSNTTDSIYKSSLFHGQNQNPEKVALLNDSASSSDTEQSPYEEVAVNISNTDDPNTLCLTFRSMLIGILLGCIMAFTSQFFAFRTSPLDLNIGILVLISYMIVELMSKILPNRIFNITINPGPFTMKEYALITTMASSGLRTYEGIETLTIQRFHFKYNLGHFNSVLFLLIVHALAISFSGILKRYLIWPGFMIWPKTLMTCSLIRTLIHENEFTEDHSRWKITRLKFFWLIVLCQFLWYWLPGYIFPLLSFFSLICIMSPKNVVLSQVTGACGLGFGAIEFDWKAWVAYLDTPILVPFWAHIQIFVGFVIVIWICNSYLDCNASHLLLKYGNFYNTSKILTKDYHRNETAYEIYGPSLLSSGFAVSYAFSFAAITALTVHTIVYHVMSAPNDLIGSYLLSGNPIAFLAFRTFTFTCQGQIVIYLTNTKIAHYMKIPPRIVFPIFLLSSAITSTIQYATSIYLLQHIPNICTSENSIWRCLSVQYSLTTTIIFSLTGSFNMSSQYSTALWGFLVGAILPILSWWLCKMYPNIKWFKFIHFPMFLMAPFGFFFNFVLYRYAHSWWEKYACIFSIAMSCGVALRGFTIFFTLQLNDVDFPEWWGLGGPNGDGCPLDLANYSGFIATNRYF
ncbi:unnamed protein product [Rotaria socialis]